MIDSLTQAQNCYQQALRLCRLPEVTAQVQEGIGLLEGLSGTEADTQRLMLLELELQNQSSASYLVPPVTLIRRFAALAAQSGSVIFQARAQYYESLVTWSTQSFIAGLKALQDAFKALVACGDIEGQFHALGNLGLFTSVTGDLEGGVALMREGLCLYDRIDLMRRELPLIQASRARLMLRLALNLFDLDYISEALDWLAQTRPVFEALGQGYGCTTEYAQVYARVGYWQDAERWALLGMRSGIEAADRAYAQILYGFILGQQGKIAQAIAQLEQALVVVTESEADCWLRALASVYLAELRLQPGPNYDPRTAQALNEIAMKLGEAGQIHYGSIYALTNQAQLNCTRGEIEQALALATDAANRVRARNTLTLVREEEVLYCEYRMLQAAGRDGRLSLSDAHQRLQTAASRIDDPLMRESFLHNVPLHRAIAEALADASFVSQTAANITRSSTSA